MMKNVVIAAIGGAFFGYAVVSPAWLGAIVGALTGYSIALTSDVLLLIGEVQELRAKRTSMLDHLNQCVARSREKSCVTKFATVDGNEVGLFCAGVPWDRIVSIELIVTGKDDDGGGSPIRIVASDGRIVE